MNREKLSINKLFYNNRFVLIASVVLAVIIWLIVALQFSPEEKQVIKNVPVKIDYSNSVKNFDLQIFGTKEYYVDVTVTGKRYVISSLLASDLVVTAKTNYVDSAGKYSLQLDVKQKSQNVDYEISNISNENIEVFFDVYKEGEYTLVPEIVSEKAIVPEGYFQDKEVLSSNKVKISGPATEVNKISQVIARVKLTKTLTSTKTVMAEIIPIGEYGSTLRYLTVNDGNEDITMTIPVYKLAQLPTAIAFKNVPLYYLSNPLAYTCTPKNALFAVPEDSLSSIESINLATIDFSNIKAGVNTITVKSDKIEGAIVRDSTKVFKIVIDAKNMIEKPYSVKQSNISVINAAEGYTVGLTSNGIAHVTVVGPKAVLKTMTADDIFAEVDLTDIALSSGNTSLSARVYLKNHDNCWVRGQYTVKAVVSAK